MLIRDDSNCIDLVLFLFNLTRNLIVFIQSQDYFIQIYKYSLFKTNAFIQDLFFVFFLSTFVCHALSGQWT